MAGLSGQISGSEVQGQLGGIARNLHLALRAVQDGQDFLSANDDAALNALYGISDGDAALLRSAFADMGLLAQVYRGEAAVTPAKDFRTFIHRIFGLGF